MATRPTTELNRSGRAGVHRRRVRGSIGRVTNETVDVVVVGAGAMGSAAAWALASADRDVVVLEQHALGHDQGGSHGGSRLFRLDYADGETLASALRAERLWRHIEEASDDEAWLPIGALESVRNWSAPHVAVHGRPLPWSPSLPTSRRAQRKRG